MIAELLAPGWSILETIIVSLRIFERNNLGTAGIIIPDTTSFTPIDATSMVNDDAIECFYRYPNSEGEVDFILN